MARCDWNLGSLSSLTREKCIQNFRAGDNKTQHSPGAEQHQMHPLAVLHVLIWAQNVGHLLWKAEGNIDHWYNQSWTQTLICGSLQLSKAALGRFFPIIQELLFLCNASTLNLTSLELL